MAASKLFGSRLLGAKLALLATLGATLALGAIASPASATPASTAELPGFDIRILPGSVIHLVSHSSKLPISIQNNYPVEIRVQVHVAASNLDALIPAVVEVTVPANTTYVAQVPVSAISDGEVTLRAWLTTFSGLTMGNSVQQRLIINADIETSAIAGFSAVVVALGVVGVIRTRSKRRTARVESTD